MSPYLLPVLWTESPALFWEEKTNCPHPGLGPGPSGPGGDPGKVGYPACSPEKADRPFAAIRFIYTFPSLPSPTSPRLVTWGLHVPVARLGAEVGVGALGGRLRRFELWARGAKTEVYAKVCTVSL